MGHLAVTGKGARAVRKRLNRGDGSARHPPVGSGNAGLPGGPINGKACSRPELKRLEHQRGGADLIRPRTLAAVVHV